MKLNLYNNHNNNNNNNHNNNNKKNKNNKKNNNNLKILIYNIYKRIISEHKGDFTSNVEAEEAKVSEILEYIGESNINICDIRPEWTKMQIQQIRNFSS